MKKKDLTQRLREEEQWKVRNNLKIFAYNNSNVMDDYTHLLQRNFNKWTNIFNHLVYPIPDENNKTLGIHLTIDRDGSAKLGPSAEELPNKEENY